MNAFFLLRVSLWVNVAILVPVIYKLLIARSKNKNDENHKNNFDKVMGPDTQGRRILSSMYCTILILSLRALFLTNPIEACKVAVPLFWMQIIYKTLSAFTCLYWNPVIYANQMVTVIHLCTLYSLHQQEGIQVLF